MTAFSPIPFEPSDSISSAGTGSLRGRFSRWLAERRRRNALARELAQLSERDLSDLGIGRADFSAIIHGTYRR
ncbi:MAG TPA: DUF1127 domain-containing protein [Acetobacteraceae bacterium]|nr:DUF1127 domain-containing protein [Acetobacteraceae bacterium]